MVSAPSAQQLALACGTAGAYVDVTDDLVTDSITGSWGRTSGFSDTRPGVLSFDLVNDLGKYTPGNSASTLTTKVRVGMGVHHIVDGMHFAGTIRSAQPYFTGPNGLSGASKIRVVCDDMLGNAARKQLEDPLSRSMVLGSTPYLYWPFNEPVGSARGVEQSGNLQPAFDIANADYSGGNTAPVFGATAISYLGETQLSFPSSTGRFRTSYPVTTAFSTINYASGSMGCWGIWVTPTTSSVTGNSIFIIIGLGTLMTLYLTYTGGYWGNTNFLPVVGVPAYLQCVLTYSGSTVTYSYFVNGVAAGTATQTISATTNAQRTPQLVDIAFADPLIVSHLSHTANPVSEYLLATGTEANVLTAIDQTVSEATLDTLPSDLSTAPVGFPDTGSALDGFNTVIRTEQGSIWTETTGAITAPVQKIKVRGRDRSPTVNAAHTFTISEIQNAPEFTTDIENMVSAATAQGPVTSSTAIDPTLVPYVGSASDSTSVLLRDSGDLLGWAQDRLIRGAATDVRLTQFTVDALQINRWTDVSALRAGDRVRISGLPSTQLGVSTIDGWLVGCSYSLLYPSLHSEDRMLFTFYMQPVLPDTAVFDTNRFMSGGEMTVNTTFNASATSISIASTGQLFTTSTDLPTTIRIEGEVLTVSAVSGSSSPQTFTVARGATDPLTGLATTAASHSAGALVEISVPSLFAF